MVYEFFRAAFLAGLPVGIVSYLLIWYALRSKYLQPTRNLKSLEKEVSQLSKARSKKKKDKDPEGPERPRLNPVHNKWLRFGGGFYGVVALMTFVIIEANEIISFFGAFTETLAGLADFDVGMIIRFIIDSMMNFVTAIAWPMYWISEIDMERIWLWFLAAYGGYWLGSKMAIGFGAEDGAEH